MNQRQYVRVPFLRRAWADAGDGRMDVQCLDMSLRGVLLSQPFVEDDSGRLFQPWQVGQVLRVGLVIAEHVVIEMTCRVAHTDDDVAGCVRTNISLDSLRHLRRTLELNLPNNHCVAQEFGLMVVRSRCG